MRGKENRRGASAAPTSADPRIISSKPKGEVVSPAPGGVAVTHFEKRHSSRIGPSGTAYPRWSIGFRFVLASFPGSRIVHLSSGNDSRRRSTGTPLGAISRGLIAGALGTVGMDAVWYGRYRRDGGGGDFASWEFSSGLCSWEKAPAPAQVGKRLFEGLFQRQLSPKRAALVNNVTHWAYGMLGGAQYGIVAESLRKPRIRYGLPFGATVWAIGYAVLPAAKLYKPIWEYDRETLAKDLSAHLVYGLGTAAALQLLSLSDGRVT